MVLRGRLLRLLLLVGIVVAVVSFIGGSVGAIMTGKPPLSLFAVGTPHLELPPGRPFAPLDLPNTLLASWLTCAVIIAIFVRATRRVQIVPTGLQNFVEYVCEFASGFIEDMVGKEHETKLFPVIMTVFLFVLGNAWLALVPGFDTVHREGVPILRSASTDINVTFMLALFCVLMIEYWGLSSRGLSYLGTFLDVRHVRVAVANMLKLDFKGSLGELLYGGLFLFVGLLELLGHAVRVLSFSFRLFGNMTAGVILTGVAIFIVPLVLPSVFYGLEVLFGLVQAIIFAGLTAVFAYAAVGASEH